MPCHHLTAKFGKYCAYWCRRLVVGVALAVPLVVLGYAPMLCPAWGHAAWVAWVMFVLAAVLQAYLGGPYLKGAWETTQAGSSNMDTLIALGTSTAFGFSVVQLLVGHAGPSRFLWGAAGVAIAIAIGVAGAVLFGDPPRFAEDQSPGEPMKPWGPSRGARGWRSCGRRRGRSWRGPCTSSGPSC